MAYKHGLEGHELRGDALASAFSANARIVRRKHWMLIRRSPSSNLVLSIYCLRQEK